MPMLGSCIVIESLSLISTSLDREGRSRLQWHELKRMVEMEDYDLLRKMGTAELLRILLSDIRQGITTVKRDVSMRLEADPSKEPAGDANVLSLAERRRTYGENKPRVWDIRQSVFEAWRPVASIDLIHTM